MIQKMYFHNIDIDILTCVHQRILNKKIIYILYNKQMN